MRLKIRNLRREVTNNKDGRLADGEPLSAAPRPIGMYVPVR
jgi:hypothetical protein